MTCTPPDDASLTVLLIDDAETQGVRIQEVLRPYGVWVEWRSSYRAATRVLHDPDMGQLIDLILIDQDFTNDEVPDAELLTHAELGAVAGTEEWDVRLHQGLFVMTRLSEDMREGLISFTPMMILTHYARVEVAARVILGGYESKRRLLSDPYTALKGHLEQLRPARADVETRIATLQAELGLDDELARDVTRSVVRGLDLEETCDALRRLPGPGDWRAVGRTLERLGEERRAFSMERLWASLGAAWLTSPQGWLRVCHVEAVASLGHDFEVFRVEICRSGTTFSALLAARALPPGSVPGVARLRESFRLVRAVDARNRPVRLRAGSWTIVGCWVPEPERPGSDARAAARRLAGATRHIRELHSKGLAHGSLTVTSAGFESEPVFGGVRCLAGGEDLSALCRDDLAQLPALAAAAFGEDPPETTRQVLACWSAAVRAGDLEHAESILESAEVDGRPPAYFECDRRLYSGGEVGFRDLLLASLGPNDAVLREVRCGGLSASPLDFVVCAGG